MLLSAVLLSSPCLAQAHFALYYNVEVDLRSDSEVRIVITIHETDLTNDDSHAFIASTFRFECASKWSKPSFEWEGEDLPEDCHLAILTAPNPGGDLEMHLSDQAEKRLLLVVTRPGAFPDAIDIAPGSSEVIPLPEPPQTGEDSPLLKIVVMGVLIAVLLAGWRFASVKT